jgi:fatty acid desaturase
MRVETWKATWRSARRHGIDHRWLIDVACQVIHYGIFLGLPAMLFGFARAAICYGVIWAVAGLLLTLIFVPAHLGLPIVSSQNKGWHHQFATTRNLRLPLWISWLFIGLDYQVEHHMFPRIPHQNMARARPILKRWCERAGMPYQEQPYLCALQNTAGYLFRAWRTEAVRLGPPAM